MSAKIDELNVLAKKLEADKSVFLLEMQTTMALVGGPAFANKEFYAVLEGIYNAGFEDGAQFQQEVGTRDDVFALLDELI